MDQEKKNENLKFIIDRYDHYYDSVNNKGNLYLTINTFILGGTIVGFFTLVTQCHFQTCLFINMLFGLNFILNLVSFGFTLTAIRPYVKGKKTASSLIHFQNVAENSHSTYSELWLNCDDNSWHIDLRTQSYLLAKGLKHKFFKLSIATWLIGGQVFCIVLFGIIILIKYL